MYKYVSVYMCVNMSMIICIILPTLTYVHCTSCSVYVCICVRRTHIHTYTNYHIPTIIYDRVSNRVCVGVFVNLYHYKIYVNILFTNKTDIY